MGRSCKRWEEERAKKIPKEKNRSLRNRIKVFLGYASGLALLFVVTTRLTTVKLWLYKLKIWRKKGL